jgi:hypothetical protein
VGGTGYRQIYDPAQGWLGWFTTRNLGAPWDQRIEHEVMSRLAKEALDRDNQLLDAEGK